jgi:two-component system nitrogen regulation response regulator NtrX
MSELHKILIIDDQLDICEQISGLLSDKGFNTQYKLSAEEGIKTFDKIKHSLVILDIWLNNSKFDGFQTLEKIRKINKNIPIIMISGHGNIETAVNSIKKGAYDFIEKPFDSEILIFKVKKALENFDLKAKITDFYKNKSYNFISKSNLSKNVINKLKKITKTESSVFLDGKKGSGREFLAKKIHSESNRFNKNFKTLDFRQYSETEIEENLFGKEINRITASSGLFEEVEGGTLFLKNIDSMFPKIQGKLLRVFEEKKYKRIGGGVSKNIDFRLICSSNSSFLNIKKNKLLRNDLLKSFNFFEIYVPSLKEREDDKVDLINEFVKEVVEEKKIKEKNIEPDIFSFFANLDFIDNTLQLKNFIKWGLSSLYDANQMTLSKDNLVKLLSDFLGNDILLNDDQILNRSIKEARESFEIKYLKYNLEKFKKNVSKMSKEIGMERTALHRKLKSLNIQMD